MAKVIPNRVFEDYDPPSDLVTEEECDTLLIYLPGFKKEQLRVQLTISRMLKISGERHLGDNKYRRFQKEFRIPSNCDTKEISAKFEGGILYIRQPKLITPAVPATAEQQGIASAAGAPRPQQHAAHRQPQQQAAPTPTPAPVPPPMPPQPQSHQQTPPAPPPPPQPQPQQQIPEKEVPAKGREDEARAEEKAREEEKVAKAKREDKGSKDEERNEKSTVKQGAMQVVNSGLFRELRNPDTLKRLGVSVLLVLIIGFYISYMFKSFMGDEQKSAEI